MQRYIPIAIYTVGIYHYGAKVPFKTIDVLADNYNKGLSDGYKILRPTTVQHVKVIEVNVNPDLLIYMDKIHGPYQHLTKL